MKKSGKVLVLGGGVGGIQASLDLASSGFYVYLVDKEPSIGGMMSRLDKTFPTNDCSTCILSPKMVETGRHLNIELLTLSEVVSIDGEPGSFKVKVRKKPRYVLVDTCKGCGDCADACPADRIFHPFEENLTNRTAIWRPFDQAVPSAFLINKEGMAPCRARCPIHLNAHGYVMAVKAGKMERAKEIVRNERNFVFAGTAARVCTHPCETACVRGEIDQPVSIREIKRYITDWEFKEFSGPDLKTTPDNKKDKKIAIIGAGPAGLSCAYDLAIDGYDVDVYDALPEGGGMLLAGIPEYRLPRDILRKEVSIVEKVADVNYGVRIDRDMFRKLVEDYDAVFVAAGAHKSRKMGIPGEDLDGVMSGVGFLKKLNLGEKVELGRRVVVVGGGNSAIDAARCARRMGSDVTVLYRRSRKEMPAIPEEVEAAMEEGIQFDFLRNPVEFIGNGRLEKVRVIKMKLGEPDESGRRRPVPMEGSEYEIEVDNVLLAIGEKPDLDFVTDVKLTSWGTIEADELTCQTSNPKVFAGGDAVTGPATFIDAVAAGKRAAESIKRYLEGRDLKEGREHELPFRSDAKGEKKLAYDRERMRLNEMPPEERIRGFQEVISCPSDEDVLEEAKRCINCSTCAECYLCVEACQPEAIVHDMVEEIVELDVGAVILSPGFTPYPAEEIKEYGFGRFKNVVTSVQFERILSASGPFSGKVSRPGDGKHPEKIAFIQCVGSRNKENPYCSSVCCMYAVKEAVIAREHDSSIHPTIFFMDIRSFGKDFDRYIDRAEKEYGVRFIKARPSSVEEDPETGNLILTYENDGKLVREEFELVVLSVGLTSPDRDGSLSKALGIELNEFGYAKTSTDAPVKTNREGIYVCGAFQGPKDIPETVAQGSAAAGLVQALLADVRGQDVKEKEYPEEKFIMNEKPRIGVFVCHCGINIGGYLDVKEVAEYAKTLPNVVYATDNLYTCSQDSQELIKQAIIEHNLNRVVVASCTPRTHEPLFQETIREAGLNKYLFTMANIRDQDSWVHQHDRKAATEKAKDLVRAAVAKARLLEPLETSIIPIIRKALVIGGGITGMNSALLLANSGIETYLVERENELGGNARKFRFTIDGMDVQAYLAKLINKVENHENIKVMKGAEIIRSEGFVGNFKTTIRTADGEEEIEHGVVIISTGAKEYKPVEYGYGKHGNVLTQFEFEEKILDGSLDKPKTIVMIQCVGSRNDEHPWCSRVCCSEAIKNSLLLKEKYPDADVYVLYRDIRSYGFKEVEYQKAREKGVVFIRFDQNEPPEIIDGDGRLRIKVKDLVLGEDLIFEPDYLVLSNGIVPDVENNETLSKFFKVPVNQDGFFLEAHAKLRPVDFATDGVFLAGLSHSPKGIDESVSQAQAAVSRALMVLSKEGIETGGQSAVVNELKCVGCGVCEQVCPYQAVHVVEKKVFGKIKKVADVNRALCKGCGACTAGCRSGAIDLLGFTDEEVLSELTAIAGGK